LALTTKGLWHSTSLDYATLSSSLDYATLLFENLDSPLNNRAQRFGIARIISAADQCLTDLSLPSETTTGVSYTSIRFRKITFRECHVSPTSRYCPENQG
jgi:hypothetical protein